eukprot:365400_1
MSEQRARFYSAQILLGLEQLHSAHIIYRDLKPDNLLLQSDGNLCLSDFGVSDRLPKGGELKKRAGTKVYMAPEVDQGKPHSYSADYYSFGITLCELLTVRRPFQSAQNYNE